MGSVRTNRNLLTAGLATAVIVGLTGCVGGAPTPKPSPSATETRATSTTNAPNPQLRPDGSAAANRQFFDFILADHFAAHPTSDGRSIIDALVLAGFLKADMEVTPDVTAIGIPVDSIVFSVRVKGECLVGQFSAAAYTSVIAPLLGNGGCLVGLTRPIDW